MLHALGLVGQPVFLPGTYTVDTLPDPVGNVGKYARVTDLFGSKTDLVLAAVDQTGTYWQPVRPDYKGVMTVTGDTTLVPLKTPSILSMNGTIPLGTTRTISLGNTNLFPGAKFTIRTKLASLLGTLRILDTVTTVLSALAINQSYTYIYDPTNGWEQI